MRIRDVVRTFLRGDTTAIGSAENLVSGPEGLFSYRQRLAYRGEDGVVVVCRCRPGEPRNYYRHRSLLIEVMKALGIVYRIETHYEENSQNGNT